MEVVGLCCRSPLLLHCYLPEVGEEDLVGGWLLLELTVELVLLLAGSCCRSWRGERARGERELAAMEKEERERGCCWGRDNPSIRFVVFLFCFIENIERSSSARVESLL